MSTLLAVDPGVRCMGWALFLNGILVEVGLSRAKTLEDQISSMTLPKAPDGLVIEEPQVYQGAKQVGSPDDLIRLAMVAGAVMARAACFKDVETILVKPAGWKGQVPKDIMSTRIMRKLSDKERSLVVAIMPKGLRHNAIDAVGIGLWALGRS